MTTKSAHFRGVFPEFAVVEWPFARPHLTFHRLATGIPDESNRETFRKRCTTFDLPFAADEVERLTQPTGTCRNVTPADKTGEPADLRELGGIQETLLPVELRRSLAVVIGINDYGNGVRALHTARARADADGWPRSWRQSTDTRPNCWSRISLPSV